MIYKRPANTVDKVWVTFELPAQFWAERIHLVGDFNGWDQTATPMRQDGPEGSWRVTLELDTGQTYQFRYVADGQHWHNDNAADGYVDNERGSTNSVLKL
jgi:1,4-alpha-glucan branching enzyme